ncbi:MAG TPA: peptidase M17, partial [Amycolatopsis sp.]|nr:peptidase M17 [Amycolatopsis sp.]
MRNPLPPVPGKLLELEVSADLRRGTPLATLIAAPSEEDGDAGLAEIGGVRPTGKAGDVQTVPLGGVRWLAGVGDGEPRRYRKAGAALVRAVTSALEDEVEAGRKAFRAFAVELPEDAGAEHVEELAFGLLLGGYRFTVTADEPKPSLRTVGLITRHERAVPAYAKALERVSELAAAAAFARDLANTPSNIKTPAWLADTAARVSGGVPNLTVTTRDEKWLAEQGFGGVLAVGGGSSAPPRLIELEYRPRGATTHLLLVGKGITF